MVYKLCYVDGNEAWFTSDWKNQWGDDWNDRPYEHNAGSPYSHYFDDDHVEHEIQLKKVYFDIPRCIVKEPNYGLNNSPYSVQDINNHRVAWLTIDTYDKDPVYLFAGVSYSNFVRQIEELGGTIYVPKKKGVK